MNVKIKKSAAELALEAQVDALLQSASGARVQALENLKQAGMPHRRQEPWVYTDLRNLMRDTYVAAGKTVRSFAGSADMDPAFAGLDAHVIVRINGYLNKNLSSKGPLPDGLTLHIQDNSPEPENKQSRYIADMVGAFAGEALVLEAVPGAKIDRPVMLLNITAGPGPIAAYSRTLLHLGEGAELTVIETHQGEGDYQASNLFDISIGDQATLTHVRHQNEDPAATHLTLARLTLGAQAIWHGFTLAEGARISRNEIEILFSAPGANANIGVAKLLGGEQHCDTTIVVDHAVPGCNSNEIIKAVLEDKARGIFQGKIIVRPGASGTDGRQSSDALLLSDTAEMDTKPELEIYNDDVQCAHGATVGEIDEDLLFYLRARGIPLKQAEALLIQAHVGAALEVIPNEALKTAMSDITARWMARRLAS